MLAFFLNPLDLDSQRTCCSGHRFLCPPCSCSCRFCSPPAPPFPPSLSTSTHFCLHSRNFWLHSNSPSSDTPTLTSYHVSDIITVSVIREKAFPKPPYCSHLDITDAKKYIFIPSPRDCLIKTKLALLLQDASASGWGLINILKGRYSSQDTFKHSLDGAVKGKPATSHQCIYTGSSKFMLINFTTSLKELGFTVY